MAKVLASGNPEFEKYDLVVGMITWGEYSVLKGNQYMLRKLDPMGFPLSYHAGIFGKLFTTLHTFFMLIMPKNL